MISRKNVTTHMAAACILAAGFLLCRYVLFDLHGMKQWPQVLFAVGVIMLLISLLVKEQLFPWFVSAAYPIGFAAGIALQSAGADPGGGRTNNLWLIWTGTFLVLSAVGIVCELVMIWRKR